MRTPPWPGLAIAVAFLLASAPVARATCTCPPTLSVEDALAAAKFVFAGQVLSLQPSYLPTPSHTLMVAKVATSARWKGRVSNELEVFTETSADDCGYPLQVDQQYLFYADDTPTRVTEPIYCPLVSLCSRTAPLEGNPDLAVLPPPELPVPVRPSTWGSIKSRYR